MDIKSIILSAGKSKRFKSNIPKVLHKICDKPMIEIIIDNVKKIIEEKNIFVVVGHEKEKIISFLEKKYSDLNFVVQEEQKGTAHAVLCCKDKLENYKGWILILCGDMPLIKENTLRDFISNSVEKNIDISFISTTFENPEGFGRVLKDRNGNVLRIVEEKDASYEIKKIKEINTGIYLVKSNILFKLLQDVKSENAQREYYLPDIIEIGLKKGMNVNCYFSENSLEFIGVNTKLQLSQAENILLKWKIEELMLNGVIFIKPETSFIGYDVKIGVDTKIYPGNFITGNTEIGKNCIIGMNNFIKDTIISDNVSVKGFSYIEKAKVSEETQIGPFAHLRPETVIGKKCKVGNFVEVKKSIFEDGVKASHLSYLGDSYIGENTNIGAGTITCNYDGVKKHKTIIGKNVFIGSDTQLVAPVKVGDYTLIAAGTTVTKDVGENYLVHSRTKQQNISEKGMKKRLKKT